MTNCLLTRRFLIEFPTTCKVLRQVPSTPAAAARPSRLKQEGPTMAKRTCSDPECDRDAIARGMCDMHYRRWSRGKGSFRPLGRSPKFIDRTGQRCGMLTVITRAAPKPGVTCAMWLCRCDCGGEILVRSGDLDPAPNSTKKRVVKSCGCLRRRGRPLPGGKAARNRVLRYYRQGASKRGLSWDLSVRDFDWLISQPCFYCGQPPAESKASRSAVPFFCNGIDRVDSNYGYAPENVVPCCTQCNKAKGDMSYDEFRAWIARLLTFHFFNPDLLPSRLLRDSGRVVA